MRAVGEFIARMARDTSGAVAAYVVLGLPAFLAATALTIDMGAGYITRNKLQITADAAALAGASALPDVTLTKSRAVDAATTNMSVAAHGQVLLDGDVVTGNWDGTTRTFTAGGSPINAVRAITRRSTANGNPLKMMLADVLGIFSLDVAASAIATADASDDCYRNGIVANGQVEVGSNSTFGVGACMHGQQGFKIGSNNRFLPGSVISFPDGEGIDGGSDNVYGGEIVEQDLPAMNNSDVAELLESIKNTPDKSALIGDLEEAPPWFDGTVVQHSGKFTNCNGTKGTLYIVSEDADLSSCNGPIDGFGIYAEKEIKLGSGQNEPNKLQVTNMFFASNLKIETGSYLKIGNGNFCNLGGGAVFFAARELFKVGSNIDLYGVQIISGSKSMTETGVEFGDDLFTSGVSAQSAGLVKMGSDPTISVCDRADQVLTGGTVNKVLRLVK